MNGFEFNNNTQIKRETRVVAEEHITKQMYLEACEVRKSPCCLDHLIIADNQICDYLLQNN